MRFPLTIACSLGLAPLCPGQELVPNPSFEQSTDCPTAPSQLDLATPWTGPTGGTPDYFHACDTSANVGVPVNAVGMQDAYHGKAYGGFFALPPMSIPDYREYLQTPLVGGPLEAGKTYRFAMELSLAEDSSAATDRIGAVLSSTAIGSGDYLPLPFTPQFETAAGTFLSDTVEWYHHDATFVAAGGEAYLTLGNFHDDANSATTPAGFGPDPPLQLGSGYYYVDMVSLQCVPCLEPPADLVGWWPLDEPSGPLAEDVAGAQHGVHEGGPTPTPGMVDGALGFLGSGVSVPSSPALELGTGDFAIDTWVIVDALGTTQTLFAKIPSVGPFTGAGYAVAVNPDGTVTFTMVDAALGVATGTSAGALVPGVWSHVTVSVDRDVSPGGRIWIDGVQAIFDPTGATGSLANTLPLRFAQDGGAGVGLDLAGTLDEVEVFGRAIAAFEIEALWESRTSGKCKIVLELPSVVAVPVDVPVIGPPDTPVISVNGGVINGTGVTGTFVFTARREPVGTWCGPRYSTRTLTADPTVLTQQPVVVGPGQTAPVRIELEQPRNLGDGLACYSITTTHLETGRRFVTRGRLLGIRRERGLTPR